MNPRTYLGGVLAPAIFVLAVCVCSVLLYVANHPLLQWLVSNDVQSHPLGSSSTAEGSLSLLYLVPIILTTFGMAYVIKRKKKWVLPLLISFAMIVSSAFIILLDYWWLDTFTAVGVLMALAGCVVFSAVSVKDFKAIRWLGPLLRLPFQVWLGTGTAMMLVLFFPSVTLYVFAGAMAVWDLYAVFKGPLKTIAADAKDGPKGLTVGSMLMSQVGQSALGLGDVVFYSVIEMLALEVGRLTAALTAGAIIAGVGITFYILRSGKKIALPGLPIPVLLAFVVIGLSYLL